MKLEVILASFQSTAPITIWSFQLPFADHRRGRRVETCKTSSHGSMESFTSVDEQKLQSSKRLFRKAINHIYLLTLCYGDVPNGFAQLSCGNSNRTLKKSVVLEIKAFLSTSQQVNHTLKELEFSETSFRVLRRFPKYSNELAWETLFQKLSLH